VPTVSRKVITITLPFCFQERTATQHHPLDPLKLTGSYIFSFSVYLFRHLPKFSNNYLQLTFFINTDIKPSLTFLWNARNMNVTGAFIIARCWLRFILTISYLIVFTASFSPTHLHPTLGKISLKVFSWYSHKTPS
jgi:hypothetical protein